MRKAKYTALGLVIGYAFVLITGLILERAVPGTLLFSVGPLGAIGAFIGAVMGYRRVSFR